MGNTCCSGSDCMGKEIRCEVDIYQDRQGGGRGISERKRPVQESVTSGLMQQDGQVSTMAIGVNGANKMAPFGGNMPELFFRDP